MERKNSIGRGYDKVASFYDAVVALTFGDRIFKLKSTVIAQLPPRVTCLIIGGGSGAILKPLITNQTVQSFYYAELSIKMMKRCQALVNEKGWSKKIEYADDWKSFKTSSFDYIFLPFVLDHYTRPQIEELLPQLQQNMHDTSEIVFFDFNQETAYGYEPSWWKKWSLSFLYAFFKLIGGTNTNQLPPFNDIFQSEGFETIERKTIINGWIQAVRLRKSKQEHKV